MKLIGHGKLTIEPHLFDVTLYGVRELSIAKVPGQVPSALQQPPASQQPLYRPAGPMHGAGGHAPGPTRPTDTLLVQKAAMPATPASNISSVPATTVPPHQQQHQEHHQHHQQHQQHQQLQHQQHQQLQHQQPPPANSDPVIHMLAQRAGQDAELKAVMKIVAAGDASPEQLQFFQRHIDELSSLLQARTAAGLPQIPGLLAAGGLGPSPRHVGTRPTSPTSDCRASSVGTLTAPQNASNPAKGRQPSLSRMYPYHSSSSPLAGMKGRAAVSVAKADHFSAVVVEFAGGTGDRFLFPRHTILEYLPAGRQVIASFLVVRDGSKAESDGYKPNKEYYQPVTISLTADDARVLSHLSRVVAWPDETRRHMDAVMDRAALANKVYLAMRLPKNPNQEEVLDLRDEAYFDATLSRSMTPVSMAPVRKPRGPYKKRVKIIDERDAGLNPSTPQ